ncbi:MAG TPA: class I SAM-dependent methyltransferase [Steroidobacteraceae bacterium]|jgi:SAM-dependent methyltransferase|nr:class I SAM-dependent methyltransferase [Steroidobacteraceae bacterium]
MTNRSVADTAGRASPRSVATSLPLEVSADIRAGRTLAGDDFTGEQLATWLAQEKEAFYQADGANSEVDPWYSYMRFLNETLGFARLDADAVAPKSVLVIGPGSGTEIEQFARRNPQWRLHFLESSENFSRSLTRKWPNSAIIHPTVAGDIELASASQSLVCAFSVLHHIPNVSKVLREVSRVLAPGGTLLVREPCSSMGDWRLPRSATPNERGIGRRLLVEIAQRCGLEPARPPVPILFEPLNRVFKGLLARGALSFPALYAVDRVVSALVSVNDHYWRDRWHKKLGPSAYFYVFRKSGSESGAARAAVHAAER